MQLHQVRYFLRIVEERHFRRSAQALGISQPSLSRAIQLLEKEVGGELIEQRRSRMHLSDLGRLVLPQFRSAIALLDQAREQARAFARERRRGLRLVLSDEADHLHATLVDVVVAEAWGADVTLDVRPQSEAADAVREGAFDIGVLADVDDPALERMPLLSSRLVIAGPSGDAFAPRREGRRVTLDALRGERFIMRSGRRCEDELSELMRQAGVERRIARVTNDNRVLARMLRAGFGVALLPEAEATALQLAYREIDDHELSVEVVLARPPARHRSAEAEAVAAALARAGSRLQPR